MNKLNEARGEKENVQFPFLFAYMSTYLIYLFISPLGSRLPQESEGLDICLWCAGRFVYVFKVGRFCLTRTMEHRDLGEDRRLPLYVYTVRREAEQLAKNRWNNFLTTTQSFREMAMSYFAAIQRC